MRIAPFLCLLALPLPAPLLAHDAKAPVVVMGALHDLHGREPAFDHAGLRAAIRAFDPDLLVLEVRPDELAGRTATPGRPEYPAVIWPLLAETGIAAVAMEPGGAMFQSITGEAGAAFADLKRRNPEGAEVLSRLDTAVEDALLAYWQYPAQTQDTATGSIAASFQAAQFALAGPAFAAAQSRWDDHMAGRAIAAVRANPDKRIMVIGSYRNRAGLERALREIAPERIVPAADGFARTGIAGQ